MDQNGGPRIINPIEEYLEKMLVEARAGRIVGMTFISLGPGGLSFQNLGGPSFPMYMACHEAADKWRQATFNPGEQSRILRPAQINIPS